MTGEPPYLTNPNLRKFPDVPRLSTFDFISRGPPPPPRYGERDYDRGYDRGGDRGDRGGYGGGGYDRYDRPPPARPVARGGTGYRLVVSNLREGTSWQVSRLFSDNIASASA